ncbi:carbohydrate-responsive element-binding protein [Plakobranchus ocellatus]|uniref:Carbohydrate-responsive element-binding protein n=1 Tax=Plakobranchus ocellatus TaxID=259542 RepID=A0AAV4BJ30_9GAST|nr:carbohydrate-responsive element-binding protein [Plakobranchus ocellatus]
MIAAGISRDRQQDSSIAHLTVGDELSSLSCDFGEVNSTEFEQLLLQSMTDPFLLDLHHLQLESSGVGGSSTGDLSSQGTCDLNSFFLEDVARPRDLHLSFPGEYAERAVPTFLSSLLDASNGEGATQLEERALDQQQVSSFFHSTLAPLGPPPTSSTSVSFFEAPTPGDETPPHSGGVTPKTLSRAASPAWSESSGNMSCGSSSSQLLGSRQRSRHHSRSSVGSVASGGETSGASIPRHKRPSHKRAEIKRRDKIKTCLEDMKSAVPSLHDKGKLSESAILIKAAEYIHHLKDGHTERGKKSAELQREIDCLSKEIHSFQENLPASGLREESASPLSLDDLHQAWFNEQCQSSSKFRIFSAITSKMWESFKETVGPAMNLSTLSTKAREWQANSLALPSLRKQILAALLSISRQESITLTSDPIKLEAGSPVDAKS